MTNRNWAELHTTQSFPAGYVDISSGMGAFPRFIIGLGGIGWANARLQSQVCFGGVEIGPVYIDTTSDEDAVSMRDRFVHALQTYVPPVEPVGWVYPLFDPVLVVDRRIHVGLNSNLDVRIHVVVTPLSFLTHIRPPNEV